MEDDDAHHAVYGDEWTNEDEDAWEAWEEGRNSRLAEQNEY